MLRFLKSQLVTHYQVLEAWGPLSLVRLTLDTGRTHQIRVHLAHIGHAVIGDPVYGSVPLRLPGHAALEQVLRAFPRQALHAEEIRFQHPESGEWCTFTAPLPADMATLLEHVRQELGGPVPSPAHYALPSAFSKSMRSSTGKSCK